MKSGLKFVCCHESFSWFDAQSWVAILQMFVGLGFVIFVHELGHFLVAKACGVKCEKFYVGFDMFEFKIGDTVIIPRTLWKKQWGETEYGIGIVPLGGYVKMLGQDDNPANAAEERERSLMKKESDDETIDGKKADTDQESYTLDPRSYQAKSVWQRMAIISAGVVMNLIFAVIFAAIAWGNQITYSPAIIGGTVAGAPAWEQNIRPGDEVLGVGESEYARVPFRYRYDLTSAIVYNGDKRDLKMTIKPSGSEDIRRIAVRPSTKVVKIKGALPPLIGIQSSSIPVLTREDPTHYGSPAWEASKDGNGFLPEDEILLVDQTPINTVVDLQKYVAVNCDKPITYTVKRKDGAEATVQVAPRKLRMLGFEMAYGPILAIQKDSPAEKAGLKRGDKILSYNGTAVGDPLTLSQRLRKLVGSKPTVLKIERNGEKEEVSIDVREPYINNVYSIRYDGRIAVDELGISFIVKNRVSKVIPDSPADEAGMQVGDVINKVNFVASSEANAKIEEEELGFVAKKGHNTFEIKDGSQYWPGIYQNMQSRLPDTKLVLDVKRGSEFETITLTSTESDRYYKETRGTTVQPMERTYTSKTIGESIERGFTQTYGDATKVVGLLGKLVRGEVSPINLGGPGTIARAATSEALQGWSHFLLFLTLISANLAVVNFLPIPVLDGGHMVFLIYEAIFRKPVSEKLQVIFSFAGLLFIVGLMLMVISLDIWRAI